MATAPLNPLTPPLVVPCLGAGGLVQGFVADVKAADCATWVVDGLSSSLKASEGQWGPEKSRQWG